jgi:hypothetical protein
MFTIRFDRVAYIAMMARQDDKDYSPDENYNDQEFVLEEENLDELETNVQEVGNPELVRYIEELNEDEQLDLVALMWVGRGTYSIDQWDEARSTARSGKTHTTSEYLLGTPMLSEYLENGLIEFGVSPEDIEKYQL